MVFNNKKGFFASNFFATLTRPARRLFGILNLEERAEIAKKKIARNPDKDPKEFLTHKELAALQVYHAKEHVKKENKAIVQARVIYQRFPKTTALQLAQICERQQGYVLFSTQEHTRSLEHSINSTFLRVLQVRKNATLPIFLGIEADHFASPQRASQFEESTFEKFRVELAALIDKSLSERRHKKRAVIIIAALGSHVKNPQFMKGLAQEMATIEHLNLFRLEE